MWFPFGEIQGIISEGKLQAGTCCVKRLLFYCGVRTQVSPDQLQSQVHDLAKEALRLLLDHAQVTTPPNHHHQQLKRLIDGVLRANLPVIQGYDLRFSLGDLLISELGVPNVLEAELEVNVVNLQKLRCHEYCRDCSKL